MPTPYVEVSISRRGKFPTFSSYLWNSLYDPRSRIYSGMLIALQVACLLAIYMIAQSAGVTYGNDMLRQLEQGRAPYTNPNAHVHDVLFTSSSMFGSVPKQWRYLVRKRLFTLAWATENAQTFLLYTSNSWANDRALIVTVTMTSAGASQVFERRVHWTIGRVKPERNGPASRWAAIILLSIYALVLVAFVINVVVEYYRTRKKRAVLTFDDTTIELPLYFARKGAQAFGARRDFIVWSEPKDGQRSSIVYKGTDGYGRVEVRVL